MKELSGWIIVHEYCATRVIKGTNQYDVRNRVAFIEKSPRVRVKPYTNIDDYKNWKYGDKGSDYGRDEDSRKWCDEELIKMGYKF
jgi:hypothetical protein